MDYATVKFFIAVQIIISGWYVKFLHKLAEQPVIEKNNLILTLCCF